MSVDEIVQRGMAQLKAAGYKMTKKRQEILRLFAGNQRYLSAKYIHQQLAKELGDSVYNCSTLYNGFKDFNEYLCAEIKQPEKAEVKRNKGLRL